MAANTAPIFPATPGTQTFQAAITAANTNKDGSGTVPVLYVAGSNGGRVDRIRCKALGTNVATVARVFLTDATGGAGHAWLVGTIGLAATTLSESTDFQPDQDYVMNMPIIAGYKIAICLGTAVAAGWQFTCFAGDY